MENENFEESNELLKRLENFYTKRDTATILDKSFYDELQGLCMQIAVDIQKLRGMSINQTLKMIFSRVYNFVISFNENYLIFDDEMGINEDYSIFDNNMEIYDDVFNACFFNVLCLFLHHTKRLKALTLRKFIYLHAPEGYYVPTSPNYFDYQSTYKESIKGAGLKSKEDAFRQYRERLFKYRPGHTDTMEWSGIRKYSEHEWILYFLKEDAPEIERTLKRIKNLYKKINEAIESPWDNGYKDRLETAYDKFFSSLEKLQYKSFLELCEFCITHIGKEPTTYGINLYRLERGLRLYRITNDVNQLLECENEEEEVAILDKSIVMQEIVFPKLYEYFGNLSDFKHTCFYSSTFQSFQNKLIIPSLLVIDKFLDDGSLGSNWENLFLETINEMAEIVLYNPENIDYSIKPESQEMFNWDICLPVLKTISYHCTMWKYSQFESDNEDDF